MGFWNKLGKIALSAAPYVAAPFTGGLSLAATGLTNKAVQKWSEKDAKNAVSKGLAPSKFDSILGKVNAGAGLASSFMPSNAFGSVGALSKAVGGASKGAKLANQIGRGASGALGGSFNGSQAPQEGGNIGRNTDWGGLATNVLGEVMNSRGGGIGPSAVPRETQVNQAVPRSTSSQYNPITAGRQAAVKSQPFREGYDITTRYGEPDEEGKFATNVQRMPAIPSDFAPTKGYGIGGSLSGSRRKQKKAS